MTANDPTSWNDRDFLVWYLSRNLKTGRIALFLGAGVSVDFGLPGWNELVDRMSARVGEAKLGPNDAPMNRCGAIKKRHFSKDEAGFNTLVKDSLYESADLSFSAIRQSSLLSALGALTMSSKRGSASKVVSFNYDNVLETYLSYHGFSIEAVCSPSHWAVNKDVVVYHPHGFLPLGGALKDSKKIVIGEEDYHQILSSSDQNAWRHQLLSIMSTHTCVYVGLSGDDFHLKNLAYAASQLHPVARERIAYNSVLLHRKGKISRDLDTTLRSYGVCPHLFDDYADIPDFLLSVCQKASEL